MKHDPRKTIRGKGWKKATNISLAKYRTISSAVLKVLTKDAMRFSDVVRGVEKRVKSFPGSVEWYTLSCLRELESQKKIIQHKTKPVGYSGKELIAGYWLWQVKSKEEAIEWVKRCPSPMPGESEIEIRQVYEMEDLGPEFTPELRAQEERLRANGEIGQGGEEVEITRSNGFGHEPSSERSVT